VPLNEHASTSEEALREGSQLTRYANEGWRATFFLTGRQSMTQVTGSAWEATPWLAVQRAVWEVLRKAEQAV
jgi:hypothetical protein